jgi:hypothetical protein
MDDPTKPKRPTADIPGMPEDLAGTPAPAADIPPLPQELAQGQPAAAPTKVIEERTTTITGSDAMAFGWTDSLKSGQSAVIDATQKFLQKLGTYLNDALDDATSLEVRTYVSENLSTVTYEKGQFTGGARLRAMTRVNIDGDSIVCIPETDGELDTAVWSIHMDMLRQAQQGRAELLKTIVSAASSLASVITPKP